MFMNVACDFFNSFRPKKPNEKLMCLDTEMLKCESEFQDALRSLVASALSRLCDSENRKFNLRFILNSTTSNEKE